VRALVRPTSEVGVLERAGVELVQGDLLDGSTLERAVERSDVVFHLGAATALDRMTWAEYVEVNEGGTARLARAAAKSGVGRFVLGSSRGVHGLLKGGVLSESTPTAPNTPYRESKLRAERAVAACDAEHGLPFVTLRLPSMIGPRAKSWLGLFRAVSGGGFRLIGRGRNRVHLCPVEDAVDVLVRAAQTEGIEGQTYVFSGRESTSLRGFLELIARELGVTLSSVSLPSAPYRVAEWLRGRALTALRGHDPLSSRYELFFASSEIDNTKARADLGYDPQVSLADAVRGTAVWYRQTGLLQ
jgi:nucleoside-diphosphate-sugar epimerase